VLNKNGKILGRQAISNKKTKDYLSATSGDEQTTFIAPTLSEYRPRFLL
jgi:hypothetical protein